jgi:hypothetical protein
VYGGRELRRAIRSRGMRYVLAIPANTALTPGSVAVTAAGAVKAHPGSWLAAAAHRLGHQGRPPLRLGHPGDHRRRHPRKPGRRAQRPADPPAPLHPDAVVLPVPDPRPGPAMAADRRRAGPLADRRRPPARQAGNRPGLRAGHPLEILAPPEHDLPARLHLPRRHRRLPSRWHRPDQRPDMIPVTELLRLLRGEVVPEPRRDPAHRQRWSYWRRHHQHRARPAHQRWNAYADTTT